MKIIEPVAGAIGAEVLSWDARTMTETDAARIRDLVYRHKLVVLRGQTVSEEEYIQFARVLGTPQIYFQPNYHHPDHPEIFVSTNIPKDGKKIGVSGTGKYWHTDCSFQAEPLSFTTLSPRIFPKTVRQTFYIDMENVYQRLPAHLKSFVDTHIAVHEAKWRYKVRPEDVDKSITELLNEFEKSAPPVSHPAVIVHPVTGQRILYINEGFTTRFEGMGIEECRPILQELFAFIERPEHVYRHVYEDGDLLIWDNRPLLHKSSGVPNGEKNLNYRIGVYDGLPFYAKSAPEVSHHAIATSV